MPDLLLHIGHFKTGSSYLQNVFRANRESLSRRHGIDYPRRGDDPTKHPVTGVNAGNAKDLLSTETSLREAFRSLRPRKASHLLLSSEVLCNELNQHRDLGFLARTAGDLGYGRVRILLFIRDPVAYAASLWQQNVKLGSTESIEETFAAFNAPEETDGLLDRLQAVDGIEVSVRNYSRCADRLLEVATAWLGLPDGALDPLPVKKVNRSLTMGELALKLELNRVIGPNCTFFTRTICERLPEMEADAIRPPMAVQERFLARLRPAMDRVNRRIAASEQLRADAGESSVPSDELRFTSEQIAAIAESLGGEINQLRARLEGADPAAQLSGRKLLGALVRRFRTRSGLGVGHG